MEEPQIKEVVVQLKAELNTDSGRRSPFHYGPSGKIITIGKHKNEILDTQRSDCWFEVNARFRDQGRRQILALIPRENIESIEISLEDGIGWTDFDG